MVYLSWVRANRKGWGQKKLMQKDIRGRRAREQRVRLEADGLERDWALHEVH